jgi:hypothetical protein
MTADADDSSATSDFAAQIWSLELRAASCDNEAIQSSDGVEKYMLSLESSELRTQAGILKNRRAEIPICELAYPNDMNASPASGEKRRKDEFSRKLGLPDRRKHRYYPI